MDLGRALVDAFKTNERINQTLLDLLEPRVTIGQARQALAASAAATVQLVERALAGGGHVPDWRPDVVGLVCAAITHEAHHRGQIGHWARELGAPLTPEQQLRLWEWDKLWSEVVG